MGTTEPRRCLGCGYILEHLPEPRCPECGRGFDLGDPATYWTVGELEPYPPLAWTILAVTAAASPLIAVLVLMPLNEDAAELVLRVLLVLAVPAEAAAFVGSAVTVVRRPRTARRAGWYAMMGLSALCLVAYGPGALSAALHLLGVRGSP
jgi:hypothetical protein